MRVCVIGCVMTTPAKKRALRASGILNPDPKDVRSELFTMDFFDAFDRAQVKYEMLRAHSVDGDSVAEAYWPSCTPYPRVTLAERISHAHTEPDTCAYIALHIHLIGLFSQPALFRPPCVQGESVRA